MRSFQFITLHGDGKIERIWQCDIFSTRRYANDGLLYETLRERLRICYFTTGDVYEKLAYALLMMGLV